jgi:hypothetical protein
MVSGNLVIQAKFWKSCRNSWNLSYLTPIASIHVFGLGKKALHGRHRCWILVMVQIDVMDFDDGHWRREVLGFHAYIFYTEDVNFNNSEWQLGNTS